MPDADVPGAFDKEDAAILRERDLHDVRERVLNLAVAVDISVGFQHDLAKRARFDRGVRGLGGTCDGTNDQRQQQCRQAGEGCELHALQLGGNATQGTTFSVQLSGQILTLGAPISESTRSSIRSNAPNRSSALRHRNQTRA
jgi:hypothetical protein